MHNRFPVHILPGGVEHTDQQSRRRVPKILKDLGPVPGFIHGAIWPGVKRKVKRARRSKHKAPSYDHHVNDTDSTRTRSSASPMRTQPEAYSTLQHTPSGESSVPVYPPDYSFPQVQRGNFSLQGPDAQTQYAYDTFSNTFQDPGQLPHYSYHQDTHGIQPMPYDHTSSGFQGLATSQHDFTFMSPGSFQPDQQISYSDYVAPTANNSEEAFTASMPPYPQSQWTFGRMNHSPY